MYGFVSIAQFQKGGDFRKWYGNHEYVVNWKGNGTDIKHAVMNNPRDNTTTHWSRRIFNTEFFFQEGVTWSTISSSDFSARYLAPGFIISNAAGGIFPDNLNVLQIVALTNSVIPNFIFNLLNPTLNYSSGLVAQCPVMRFKCDFELVKSVMALVESDWDAYERSWNFQLFPLLSNTSESTGTLESSYTAWITQNKGVIAEMKRLEEDNNRLFINAYGLQDELTPEVPIEQITLTVNPAYRYGIKGTEEERNTRFREDTMAELVSYAIGCMMGRYSLDEPGLIYANSGNEGFDASHYTKFPADDDGIIPLTDNEWFADDAVNRLVEFISVAWDKAHLEENLDFLAASLSPKKGEGSRDTVRRYLCDKFYKDHMQTYKKRPIYWLFSSGKQKAFQCLVYLHRYNESTLARMRTEYVIPLLGKYEAYAEQLGKQLEMAESTQDKKRLERELKSINKKQSELREFDDKLKHYADMRILIDLDDGVKENYGKFGDLLAEVKKITGEKPEMINAN